MSGSDRVDRCRDSLLKVIFEFVGGSFDGETLVGRLYEDSDAQRHYLLINHGAIGRRIRIASD